MSETNLVGGSSEESSTSHTAGQILKTARESAGLHVAALAVLVKVPVKKIEALEANRFDLLPDAVFVRALASSMCRTLKIDVTSVLEKLPKTTHKKLIPDNKIYPTFKTLKNNNRIYFSTRSPIAIIFALLSAAFLVFVYPYLSKINEDLRTVIFTAKATELKKTARVDNLNTTSVQAASNKEYSSSDTQLIIDDLKNREVSNQNKKPFIKDGRDVDQQTDIILFKAHDITWIEVKDAKGASQLKKNLQANEVVGVNGILPLYVVIGRADVTEVEIRGSKFNFSNFVKENVAKFEIK